MQYLRARYYDSGIGRFTQQDTYMGNNSDPISLHKYLYANTDPANWTDPTGNFGMSELAVTMNIVSELSLMQVDAGLSALDMMGASDSSIQAARTGFKVLGLASLGAGGFQIMKILSKKFRKACNSFTEDTLVSTGNGLKRIADIKIGDKVWAYNEETGEKSLQEVIHLINGEGDKEIVDITLMSGEVIQATSGHPFYVNNADGEWSWLNAGDLVSGSTLTNLNGNELQVASVDKYLKQLPVYNLTVDKDHTYYVGEDKVLNHNDSICNPLSITSKSLEHIFMGNKTGGFHSRPMGMNLTNSRVLSIKSKVTSGSWKGAYNARVKICPQGAKCYEKDSSFFPDSWSKSRVQTEIKAAYIDALSKGKKGAKQVGRSPSGGQIEMIVKPNGELVTAYPKF